MNNTTYIKALIASAKSQFVSVTFVKKDGTPRTIVFNKNVRKGILGDKATESGKRAVQTRRSNHPDLLSVCDSNLAAKGLPIEQCWRSVDLTKVKRVKVDGKEITI